MTLFNVRSAKLIVPGFHPDPSICEAEKATTFSHSALLSISQAYPCTNPSTKAKLGASAHM